MSGIDNQFEYWNGVKNASKRGNGENRLKIVNLIMNMIYVSHRSQIDATWSVEKKPQCGFGNDTNQK